MRLYLRLHRSTCSLTFGNVSNTPLHDEQGIDTEMGYQTQVVHRELGGLSMSLAYVSSTRTETGTRAYTFSDYRAENAEIMSDNTAKPCSMIAEPRGITTNPHLENVR